MTLSSRAFSDGTRKPVLTTSGTRSTSGDGTAIIPAPGTGKRIVIIAFQMQNESSTATTMKLVLGSGGGQRELWRVRGQNQGDGCGYPFQIICDEAQPLFMNLDGNNSCGYSVAYYIEAVG